MTSALGNVALLVAVAVILVYAVQGSTEKTHQPLLLAQSEKGFEGIASLFGIVVFAFAGHTEAILVCASMQRKEAYRYVVALAAVFMIPLFVAFAYIVHRAYGAETNQNIFWTFLLAMSQMRSKRAYA